MKQKFLLSSLAFLISVSVSVALPTKDIHDIINNVDINVNSTLLVDEEDSRLTFVQLVRKYGYHVEAHTVTTKDGYILTLHRLWSPKCDNANKPVVFLQHGLLASSFDWVIIGPGKSLAYRLADQGYDVWLGNFRGNIHSTNHVSLDPKKDKFWDFSWDEMAEYDLPCFFDYVIETTGTDVMSYIGHSQGTTTFLIFCEKHPQYSKYFNDFIALAAVAYFKYTDSLLLNFMALNWPLLDLMTDVFGVENFDPPNSIMSQFGALLCGEESSFKQLCSNVLFILCGWDTELFDEKLLPILMGHSPAGSSVKQMIHYAQCMSSNRFRKYDYGLLNIFEYGSLFPPDYDLSKVNTNCHFIYSENDNFAAVKDVEYLYSLIPQKHQKGFHKVPFAKFNHLDYTFGKTVEDLVYKTVEDILAQTNGNSCCSCGEN